MRETVPSPVFATQTAPAPNATADGSSPTRIVVVEPESGSIRHTTSSPAQATQIAPSPKASAAGRRATLNVRTGPASNVRGLKRCTVASPRFATQTASRVTSTALGVEPVSAEPAGRTATGRTRASVESPNAAQTKPRPRATDPVPAVYPLGANEIVLVTRPNCGSMRDSSPRSPWATQTAP